MAEIKWKNDTVSMGVFKGKYAKDDKETPEQFVKRVGSIVRKEIRKDVEGMIAEGMFSFGGRIMYGAGRKDELKATMQNCFIEPMIEDSLDDINRTTGEMARIYSRGGGVGINISNLRPDGFPVNNSAETSTGAVSFLPIFDSVGNVIGARGRRAALMTVLDCSHPDLEQFVDTKEEGNKLASMNISIMFNDEFMTAVDNNKDYALHYYEPVHKKEVIHYINARKFFKHFCEVVNDWGDPGCLFKSRMDSWHYLSGYKDYNIVGTNPCGEVPGTGYEACCLGSLNAYKFIDNPFTDRATLNVAKLKHAVAIGILALNDVLDYGYDSLPLDANRDVVNKWRSIGLGVFGLADAFVAMGIKYGSEESIEFVGEFFDAMQQTAVAESCNEAIRKGPFGAYDQAATLKSKMLQSLPDELIARVRQNGLRNGSLLSVAPTGSISLFMGRYSGGCEPLFKLAYERTTHKLEDEGKHFRVFAKSVEDLIKAKGLDPNIPLDELKAKFPYLVESQDVLPVDRVKLQGAMQMYVDKAISSTVNLPNSATPEDVYNIYVEAWVMGCKGITVFRDGCKRGNILGIESKDNVAKQGDVVYYDSIKPEKRGDIKSIGGITALRYVSGMGKVYITINKTDDGKIFEVFTNTTQPDTNTGVVTRMTSLSLRCGVSVKEIIKQLETGAKKAGMFFPTVADAVADVLAEVYTVSDTTPVVQKIEIEAKPKKDHSNFKCPECGSPDVKIEGHCFVCESCGCSGCMA